MVQCWFPFIITSFGSRAASRFLGANWLLRSTIVSFNIKLLHHSSLSVQLVVSEKFHSEPLSEVQMQQKVIQSSIFYFSGHRISFRYVTSLDRVYIVLVWDALSSFLRWMCVAVSVLQWLSWISFSCNWVHSEPILSASLSSRHGNSHNSHPNCGQLERSHESYFV